MTVQPFSKTQVLNDLHGTLDSIAGYNLSWSVMSNGDTGSSVFVGGNADKSFQVTGTFGSGGSVTLEGGNDNSNFFALTTPTGSTIAVTSGGVVAVTEAVEYVRPHATAGDATTQVNCIVFARNTQVKF